MDIRDTILRVLEWGDQVGKPVSEAEKIKRREEAERQWKKYRNLSIGKNPIEGAKEKINNVKTSIDNGYREFDEFNSAIVSVFDLYNKDKSDPRYKDALNFLINNLENRAFLNNLVNGRERNTTGYDPGALGKALPLSDFANTVPLDKGVFETILNGRRVFKDSLTGEIIKDIDSLTNWQKLRFNDGKGSNLKKGLFDPELYKKYKAKYSSVIPTIDKGVLKVIDLSTGSTKPINISDLSVEQRLRFNDGFGSNLQGGLTNPNVVKKIPQLLQIYKANLNKPTPTKITR